MWSSHGELLAGGASNDEEKGSSGGCPDDLLEFRGFRLAKLPHVCSQGLVSHLAVAEVVVPESVCGTSGGLVNLDSKGCC
eukprot:12888148-Prorocentrum_lima.AAC.1